MIGKGYSFISVSPKKVRKSYMYFFPRYNALYSRIVDLKSVYRYLLTGFVLLVLGGIWFLVGYGLLNEQITYARAEIKRLHEQERIMKQSTIDIHTITQSIANMQTKLTSLSDKRLFNEIFQAAILTIINQAGVCGLAMKACTAEQQKDHDWYIKNTVAIDVSGTFEQLLKFVQSLSASDFLCAMHQAAISHVANTIFNVRCDVDVIGVKMLA